MSFKQDILQKLSDGIAIDIDSVVLEIPKDENFGDFATPVAFSLAKVYKKAPQLIAQDLAQKLESSAIFESIKVVNGFINFRLNDALLDEGVSAILSNGFGVDKPDKPSKILLEFVSANPTGPLHIGHARGAILGEALAGIGRFLGMAIDKEYYVNDAGNQIALLGLSLQIAHSEERGKTEIDYPEDYYRGEHLTRVMREIVEAFGDDIFAQENFDKLCDIGKDKMLELIKSDLSKLGIGFDFFVSERELYKESESIIKRLSDNGGTYQKEDKLWIASSKCGDEKDRVILKDDGTPTYLAGDIIYHNSKFERGYDHCINIWGSDHHGYIARVKSAIDFLGFDSGHLEIILSQMVALLKEGQPYKMSKRKGTFVLLSDVLEEIDADALKLTFLSKKSDTHLEFDIASLSKKDASNPIFYIQYAHTRIASLMRKSEQTQEAIINAPLKGNSPALRKMVVQSLLLVDVLRDVFEQRTPHKLIDYLYDLATSFHSFYNQNTIIGGDDELLYLKVAQLVGASIKQGLGVIGIEAKDRM